MSSSNRSNDGFNSSQLDATPQSVVETSHASASGLKDPFAQISSGKIHYNISKDTFRQVKSHNSDLNESRRCMTELGRELLGVKPGNVDLDKVIPLFGKLREELDTVIRNGKLSAADKYFSKRVTKSLATGDEHFTRAKSLLAESQGIQGDDE
nr:hypothetical protein L204_06021 [Cryptococcus depauperatus CBS 7855]